MIANGGNMLQPKSDHVRPSFCHGGQCRGDSVWGWRCPRKHRWTFAIDCLGKCLKTSQCPHRRSLQFFVKSTVRPSEFRILHSHQRLGYDAVWPNSWGGDMRELLTSGSSDTVQAVYEAIEPQTPLAKTIKQHGFVRFITSMKTQMSQHWSHEHALRWAVFVEMASIHENM